MRFFAPLKTLSHQTSARLTQIDYDREMALALIEPGPPGAAEGLGVARIAADPDFESAEFAVTVRSDHAGRGLGRLLMSKIIDYGRRRGLKTMFGIVMADNQRMLALGKKLGFKATRGRDDPHTVRLELEL